MRRLNNVAPFLTASIRALFIHATSQLRSLSPAPSFFVCFHLLGCLMNRAGIVLSNIQYEVMMKLLCFASLYISLYLNIYVLMLFIDDNVIAVYQSILRHVRSIVAIAADTLRLQRLCTHSPMSFKSNKHYDY